MRNVRNAPPSTLPPPQRKLGSMAPRPVFVAMDPNVRWDSREENKNLSNTFPSQRILPFLLSR